MQPLRESQAAFNPKSDDQRMEPSMSVEVDVLSGINQVEARHPTNNPGAEDDWRQIEPTGLSDPGAGGRDGKGEPKEEMRRTREAFRHGIEKDDRQGDGREDTGQAIDAGAGNQE